MEESASCSFGIYLPGECKVQQSGMTSLAGLSNDEKELLKYRILKCLPNLDFSGTFQTICAYHKKRYLTNYDSYHSKCVDPFNKHPDVARKKSLYMVPLDLSKKLEKKQSVYLAPGERLCITCKMKIYELVRNVSTSTSPSFGQSVSSSPSVPPPELSEDEPGPSNVRQTLNESLMPLGCSPVNLHGKHMERRRQLLKTKLARTTEKLKRTFSDAFEVERDTSSSDETIPHIGPLEKGEMWDAMLNNMKVVIKGQDHTYEKKVQMLTLLPGSEILSVNHAASLVGVSQYMITKARNQVRECGLYTLPCPRTGKPLDLETKQCVIQFYQDDENSRQMPGKSDSKKDKETQSFHSKRLVLCNLKELYQGFKVRYPDLKVGFSKFASLRPKWCVLAGSSGTHSVCVCTIHQNPILLIQAIGIKEKYSDLLAKLVCDGNLQERDCCMRICENCPDKTELRNYLQQKFEDLNEPITYHQWTSTDRTELSSNTATMSECIDILVDKLHLLVSHSFISKSQSRYFREQKEKLETTKAVIMMDFSENYSFQVQDEAQGFHWNRRSCTLHPVVIYYNMGGKVENKSYCFLSDDMNHDVAMVYVIQEYCSKYIKELNPAIMTIEYFTDGCAGQYKNRKSFMNLCLHQKDFGLDAKWSFFATSHGKGSCDGIGGTVKRLAARASLQRVRGSPITSPQDMFDYCSETIHGISFTFLSKEEVDNAREKLETRFDNISLVKGTRSFHQFVPLTTSRIGTKRLSSDNEFSYTHDFHTPRDEFSYIRRNGYVAAVYFHHWYVALVLEIDYSEGDAHLDFMHPHGPSNNFHWPEGADRIWVPFAHILCSVNPPIQRPRSNAYRLDKADVESITKLI